jgi:predicted nucleotidyltransferase component of viral defense system
VIELKDMEIKRDARLKGVPISTIERDIAQSMILASINEKRLVFKGGTCIQKIYINGYRFSDDLDFTLTEFITKEELVSIFNVVCEKAGELSGIDFSLEKIIERENGFEGKIEFKMIWRGGNPTKIKLDLTRNTNEPIIIPPVMKPLLIDIEELRGKNILCYEFNEIMAEKVRSLFQRTRPRDLYDVWSLSMKTDPLSILSLITKKFQNKSIKMNMDNFGSRKESFKRSWNNSLIHQMREVPEFESVFEKVIRDLEVISR